MNADEFAKRLSACAMTVEELLAEGCSEHEARTLRSEVEAQPREGAQVPIDANPIFDLIARYDLRYVQVGVVRFSPALARMNHSTAFGDAAGDLLVVDDETGRVQLLDHGNSDYLICECALDSSRFLDALIAGMQVPTSPFRGDEDCPLEECIHAAGGEDFRAFYSQILGWGLDEA